MYNHSKHAGNEYDVFKHDWLLKIVDKCKPKVYFESHCGFARYDKPAGWESSWIKVHKATKCLCILCDTNPEVVKTVPREFIFKNTDGFVEAHSQIISRDRPDFFFIDPPYVDEQDWILTMKLIKKLQDTNIKWIVWYPLVVGMENIFNFGWVPAAKMYWRMADDMYGCSMMFGNLEKEFGGE